MIEGYYQAGYVIEKVVLTDDGGGSKTESWSTDLTVDGHLRSLSGQERIANAKLGVESTHRFYTANAAINESHRLKDTNDSDKIYEIKFVNPKKDMNNEIRHLEIDLLSVE